MPKIARQLTNVEVHHLKRVGWHAVGGVAGLLLQIRKPSTEGAPTPRSWILRIRIGEKRHPIGLGSYPQVSLAEARDQAKKLVMDARQGIHIVNRKKMARSALISEAAKHKTFKECAEAYMEAHRADYSNDKHRKQWPATLIAYAYPVIGNMLVSSIEMRDIRNVLEQETLTKDGVKGKLWYVKTETAKRLLGRMKTILDYALVNEYRSGVNPAQWSGFLATQLPSPKKIGTRRHHPALPYQMAAEFMAKLRKHKSLSAKALEFLILTAVRSGSVRQADWNEIDFAKKLWIIPAAHTKAREEHRVPLQPQAIKLLKSLPRIAGSSKLFPSPRGSAMSDMAISELMRGMRERGELTVDAVPHGFRSTFRDWAAEQTDFSDEIRKAASGHAVGDATKGAYQRTDLLEKRRKLMEDWANFIDQGSLKKSASVTALRRRA